MDRNTKTAEHDDLEPRDNLIEMLSTKNKSPGKGAENMLKIIPSNPPRPQSEKGAGKEKKEK